MLYLLDRMAFVQSIPCTLRSVFSSEYWSFDGSFAINLACLRLHLTVGSDMSCGGNYLVLFVAPTTFSTLMLNFRNSTVTSQNRRHDAIGYDVSI